MAGKMSPGGSFASTKSDAEIRSEHSSAVVAGNKQAKPTVQRVKVNDDDDLITIIFIDSGLTAWGQVWIEGRNVTIRKDSASWQETCDRFGKNSWLELDAKGQHKRWGKQYFQRVVNPDGLSEIKEPRIPRI